jgi:hypothetical protein
MRADAAGVNTQFLRLFVPVETTPRPLVRSGRVEHLRNAWLRDSMKVVLGAQNPRSGRHDSKR